MLSPQSISAHDHVRSCLPQLAGYTGSTLTFKEIFAPDVPLLSIAGHETSQLTELFDLGPKSMLYTQNIKGS